MTSRVLVDAHAGWPIQVTRRPRQDGDHPEAADGEVEIVPAGTQREFSIWDGNELIVREMKQHEADALALGAAGRAAGPTNY